MALIQEINFVIESIECGTSIIGNSAKVVELLQRSPRCYRNHTINALINYRRNSMEDKTKPAQPVIGEYQGKLIIRIPTADNPNPDTT